jgi:uncharacterized membrane protein HdeD (DUF308 family)
MSCKRHVRYIRIALYPVPNCYAASAQRSFPVKRVNVWVLRNAWIFDFVRGVVSLLFGLALWFYFDQALTVGVLMLGVYLLADGVFDIAAWYQARQAGGRGWARLLTGLLSVFFALATFVLNIFAFVFLVIYFGVRMMAHGAIDLYQFIAQFTRAPDPEHPAKRFLWLSGIGLLSFGLFTVAFSLFVPLIFAVYLGLYFVFDGVVSLFTAATQAGVIPDRFARLPGEGQTTHGDLSADDGSLRAFAFVRHSGAMGMGHAGWAFEWPNGWFNCGSVENRSGAPYTPGGKADFWTANTQDPVATMVAMGPGYDEYKVFHVSNARPKDAWASVAWISRQPYFIQRRNCADATYDVLRAFGVDTIFDTSQKSMPNEWYAALPGPSYPIAEYPHIPLAPAHAAQLARTPVKQLVLEIPAAMPATARPGARVVVVDSTRWAGGWITSTTRRPPPSATASARSTPEYAASASG